MYITDKRYISVSDAKEWEKHPSAMEGSEILAPTYVSGLQPSVQTIVDRVNSIDRTSLRVGTKPDQRMIATKKPRRTGIVGFLKSIFK